MEQNTSGSGKKALIAMSGGVDSSVAAFLVKNEGYDCIGITMKLFEGEGAETGRGRSCCSLDDVKDAENAAAVLGIAHYVNNFSGDFKKNVIDTFVESYIKGTTPNPCIDCNRYLKFDRLLLRAKELGMDYIATGHYAIIEKDSDSDLFILKKAKDLKKDQSYFLYSMTQEQLSHTLFPLGSLEKNEVRIIAEKLGFKNAHKEESQDICFVPNGNYGEFIERYTGQLSPEGNYIDLENNILGKHKGIIRYTIGQRRGINISLNKPMYVHSKNIIDNTVTLSEDKDLFRKSLQAGDFNWISGKPPSGSIRARVKIRYNQSEQWAEIKMAENNTVYIEFDKPQRAIAAGQAAVIYDGDTVLGGGTILC